LFVHRGQVDPVLFALVNPEMEEERRHFFAVKENFPVPSPEECAAAVIAKEVEICYVDRFFEGQVWFLFEIRELAEKQGSGKTGEGTDPKRFSPS